MICIGMHLQKLSLKTSSTFYILIYPYYGNKATSVVFLQDRIRKQMPSSAN